VQQFGHTTDGQTKAGEGRNRLPPLGGDDAETVFVPIEIFPTLPTEF